MKLFKRFQLFRCLSVCFGIICLTTLSLRAQDVAVTGKVISAADATPLMGVSVQVQGTSKGVATDMNGAFSISAPVGAILKFTFIGYIPQEVKVAKAGMIQVKMQEDVQKLNETVVVGYGTQKKATLTGAIAVVDMSEKEGQPITNVSNALHGTPGLFVNLSNSQPGVDRSTIRIRGVGTLSNNNPLVLVDGIEYSMDELNPNDIESIEVLKDASATAIYGSRGANGVVIITTKKGKAGQNTLTYDAYYGTQKVLKKVDVLTSAKDWALLKNDARANSGKAPYYTQAQIDALGEGTDWQSRKHSAPAPIQNHQLSLTGGDDRTRYSISGNYFKQNGVLRNTDFERYSGRINLDRDFSPN